MVLSSAAQFQRFMCETAVFVKHEVLEEPEHDLYFYEIPIVFLLPYNPEFILTLDS